MVSYVRSLFHPSTHICGMSFLGSARLIIDLLALAGPISRSLRRPLSLLRSSYVSPSSNSTRTHWQPSRRAFSSMQHFPTAISLTIHQDGVCKFYTCCSMVYLSNRNLILSASMMLFAMQSGGSFSTSTGYVDLQPSPLVEVVLMSSTFQSSMKGDLTVFFPHHFARRFPNGRPYSVPKYGVPKYYTVASKVATMDFLRSSGLPVPRVYGCSAVSDNAVST